jgi:hypothetical protein
VTLGDVVFRKSPMTNQSLCFSYFLFELPKNMTNTIEAIARVVTSMKSIIRLDLYQTRAFLSSALRDGVPEMLLKYYFKLLITQGSQMLVLVAPESRLPPLIDYPVGRAKAEGSVIGRVRRSLGEFLDRLL